MICEMPAIWLSGAYGAEGRLWANRSAKGRIAPVNTAKFVICLMCPPMACYGEKGPEKELHMKGLNDGEDPPIKLFDSTHWRNAGLVVMIRTMVMCQKETDTHYGTAILAAYRVRAMVQLHGADLHCHPCSLVLFANRDRPQNDLPSN